MKSIHTEIAIQAPLEKVWQVFSDFNNYPNWNPFIISISGQQWVGGKLNVTMKQQNGKTMTFKPQVEEYENGSKFSWLGRLIMPGIFDGEHHFSFESNGNGTTIFKQWENFEGILLPILGQKFLDSTQQNFEEMNLALKKQCEYVQEE